LSLPLASGETLSNTVPVSSVSAGSGWTDSTPPEDGVNVRLIPSIGLPSLSFAIIVISVG